MAHGAQQAGTFLALCVAALAGCTPDVAQNPGPGPSVVAEFAPGDAVPVIPLPNDLLIDPVTHHVAVPKFSTDSPAQTELNADYLGTLNGFPFETVASVLLSGALDPSRVGPTSVIGLDLTTGSPVTVAPTYDAAAKKISIPPPGGGWTRAHQYAIALLAGSKGLRGAAGEPVIGSQTWVLVSSPNPLVDCPGENLKSPDCTLAVDVIPSTQTDPAARLADQLNTAKKLEVIRRGYAPILAKIEKTTSLTRPEIPILWTFTIVDAGEVTFDPANSVIPFPNDVLLSNGKVALPNPITKKPLTAADCSTTSPAIQLFCGLNTLDGFSTLVAPISENSAAAGAVEQASIDPSTLNVLTVGLVAAKSTAPAAEQTKPSYSPCLNCLSSPGASGPQTSPQQLQWKLAAPLDEKTTYLAWVSGGVKDDHGVPVVASPTFALVRLTNSLVVNGHSAVSLISDAQAAQLEPLRAAMKPALDGLASAGFARSSIALAWAFTTQSEATQLDSLRTYPAQVPNLPDSPLYVYDATAQYQAIATGAGVTNFGTNVGKVLVGVFVTPVAVTGPGGTLNVTAPTPEPVTFTMAIPATAAPAGGYPVAIFGHDVTRSHNDFVALAGALADPALGEITIAPDSLLNGERSSCTGSTATTMQSSDDAACADPMMQKCDEGALVGRCVARDPTTRLACTPGATGAQTCANAGQGACLSTGTCEGGDFLRDGHGTGLPASLTAFQRPVISGSNLLSLTNPFGTRDNLRQDVIDVAQLVRVLRGSGTTSLAAQAGVSMDLSRLGYVGQSFLGLGALYNAVSPDTTNVILDVPGSSLPQIIFNAPAFASQKTAAVATLAQLGIQPGTPDFDQFVGFVQWALDPADAANVAWRLTHPVDIGGGVTAPGASRKALIQFIEGDQTVPSASSLAVVAGANRSFTPTPPGFGCASPLFCYEFTEAGDGFDATTAPLASRHGFLLKPPSSTTAGLTLTAKAQTQVATFLATGRLP